MEKIEFNMKECLENFGKLSKAHRLMIRDAGLDPSGKNSRWYTENKDLVRFKKGDPIKPSQVDYLKAIVKNPNTPIEKLSYQEARQQIRQISLLLPERDELYIQEWQRIEANNSSKKTKTTPVDEPIQELPQPVDPDDETWEQQIERMRRDFASINT